MVPVSTANTQVLSQQALKQVHAFLSLSLTVAVA
jgi:hypothetical protein